VLVNTVIEIQALLLPTLLGWELQAVSCLRLI